MSSQDSNQKTVQFWHHLTASEIQALAGSAVTILPIGATEQHGPHMVTGTDTLLNDLVQRGLSERPPARGEYLVLPTLAVGASDHHIPFGGTLTLPPVLYTQVLVAMVRGLIKQGHQRIFLLNSHGGNISPMNTAIAELAEECTQKGVLLGGASYWTLSDSRWRSEIPSLKLPRVGHACEIEASLLMVARPDLPLRCRPEGVEFPEFLLAGLSIAGTYDSLSAPGFVGFPAEAGVEKGEALFKIAVECVGESLARFSEMPLTADLRKG
jgi:creatinine amidohydrolase